MKLHLPASYCIIAALTCSLLQTTHATLQPSLSLHTAENNQPRQTVRNILDEWIRFIPRIPELLASPDQQQAIQEWEQFTSRLEEWDNRIDYKQYSNKTRFATLAQQAQLALPLIEKAIKEKPESPLTRKIQPSTVLEEIRQLAQYPSSTPVLYRYHYSWTGHNAYAYTTSGTRIPIRATRNSKEWDTLIQLNSAIRSQSQKGANIIIKGTREPITGFFVMEEWHLATPFIAEQKNPLLYSGDTIEGTFRRYTLYPEDFPFRSIRHPEQYCKPAGDLPGELLVQPDTPPDYDAKHPNTALLLAAIYDDQETAIQALAQGADANTSHPQIGTPLLLACRNENLGMARLLVEHGALPQAIITDHSLNTPKMTFSECLADAPAYNETIWNDLLQHGLKADPACLPIAASRDSEKLVKRLLDMGLDIEARDSQGRTAFINAALQRNQSLIRLLIERGADINATTPDGLTALDLVYEQETSRTHPSVEFPLYLMKIGVKLNKPQRAPKLPIER